MDCVDQQFVCSCCWVVSVTSIDHCLFSHLPIDEYLYCFQSYFQYIVTRFLYRSFCGHMFSFLFLLPGSGNAGSPCRRSFSFIKRLPNSFPKWLDHFTLPPTMWFQKPHAFDNIWACQTLILTTVVDAMLCLIVVLIFIFLITTDVKHFIHVSSFVKYPFKYFVHFSVGLFSTSLLSFGHS